MYKSDLRVQDILHTLDMNKSFELYLGKSDIIPNPIKISIIKFNRLPLK